MSTDTRTAPLQEITLYLEENQRLIYVELAVLALLLAHFATTFGIEVERIWKAKQSRITALFYIIRYLPPLCTAFSIWVNTSYEVKYMGNTCRVWWWLDALMCAATIMILCEALMIMRIWALYSFSRRVLIFLASIFICGTALASWTGIAFVAAIRPLTWPREEFPIPGCPNAIPNTPYSIPILIAFNMLSTGTVFVCTLRQCIARSSNNQSYLGTWRDLFGIQTAWPIVHILIRDGCLYFLIVFSTALVLLVITSVDQSFAFCATHITQAGLSVPATLLVLNLRERTQREDSSQGLRANELPLQVVSNVEFARGPESNDSLPPFHIKPGADAV